MSTPFLGKLDPSVLFAILYYVPKIYIGLHCKHRHSFISLILGFKRNLEELFGLQSYYQPSITYVSSPASKMSALDSSSSVILAFA